MKINNILAKLTPFKNFILRYDVIIFIILVGLVFGFMTLKIANYSDKEPTSDQVDERKNSLRVVKLDDTAVQKIQQLEDQNINIESLFNNGRANPFE
jgi:hypothetical protein